jgi:hypothetical protein
LHINLTGVNILVKMNILITGGTGFIGSALSRELQESGYNVLITTRRKTDIRSPSERLLWNPPTLIPSDVISNMDAVINLAGESIISGRWTKKRKERIMSSRIDTTRALVQSIQNAKPHPKTLISASAVGYYGPHGDESLTEASPPGTDFLAKVCKAWEAEALKAQQFGVRVVLIRLGIVLEIGGGALSRMLPPFKFFLGGSIGTGRQWFSWIHRDDVIGIIKYILEKDNLSGPINLTAPRPVTNREFSSALGKALGRPSWLMMPGFMLKLLLGEMANMLLTGQRVIPAKILKAGYQFKYPEVNSTLRAILK